MDTGLKQTLVDAAAMLDEQSITFAVIGGLAVSFRGQPRMTVDVDIVIRASIDDAMRLVESLPATPFEPLFEGVAEVVTSAFILPLRHRRSGVRLDLAIGMSGFEQDAIGRAARVDVSGTLIPVVSVEDLLVMKALAGRPQDDQDIHGIIGSGGNRIDWDRCLAVADALGAAIDLDIAARLRAARHPAP